MADILTEQDKTFVKEVIKTGNGTQSAKKAYNIKDDNYAGVKAHEQLRKPKIRKVILSIAEQLPDAKLAKVHLEGLEATKTISLGKETIEEPDYSTRHKYLDSAYKLKGSYAAEKHINLNLNESLSEEDIELAKQLRAIRYNTRESKQSARSSAESLDGQVQNQE